MGSGDRPSTDPKPSGKKRKRLSQKEQSERFKEAARQFDADDSGNAFDNAIRVILPPKKA